MVTIDTKLNWLNYLDESYIVNSIEKNNTKYFYYPSVKIDLLSDEINIIFRKINKTKTQFFFEDQFNRRFYYRDVDLINLLVDSPSEVFDLFSRTLKSCIDLLCTEENEKNFSRSIFHIEGRHFEFFNFCDISIFLEKQSKASFLCPAGFRVSYVDVVFLINLILHKEYIADDGKFIRVNRLAKKFYVLSNFYKNRTFFSELSKHSFEVDKFIEDVYDDNKKAKTIDKIFDLIVV